MTEVLAGIQGKCSLDFETTGLDPFQPDSAIRVISLATEDVVLAIDVASLSGAVADLLWDWVQHYPEGFLIHNAAFDCSWARLHGKGLRIDCCTMTLFRHLTTEGWLGQSWSLKTAMVAVLGWAEPNTAKLDEWLKERKLDKSSMSQAPWEILGPYAALDADATYQLYVALMKDAKKLPRELYENLVEYHQQDCINAINLLVEQQLAGLPVNLPKLNAYSREKIVQIEAERLVFFAHQDIRPIIESLKCAKIQEHLASRPEEKTKTGTTTVRFKKWKEELPWLESLLPHEVFNIDSPKQLCWLFYTRLGYPVKKRNKPTKLNPVGGPSVDNEVLPQFGEVGGILARYRKLRDALKFATSLSNVQVDGIFHPSVTFAGAVTGRCSGGNQI